VDSRRSTAPRSAFFLLLPVYRHAAQDRHRPSRNGISVTRPPRHEFLEADRAVAVVVGHFEREQAFIVRPPAIEGLKQAAQLVAVAPALAVAVDEAEGLAQLRQLAGRHLRHVDLPATLSSVVTSLRSRYAAGQRRDTVLFIHQERHAVPGGRLNAGKR